MKSIIKTETVKKQRVYSYKASGGIPIMRWRLNGVYELSKRKPLDVGSFDPRPHWMNETTLSAMRKNVSLSTDDE